MKKAILGLAAVGAVAGLLPVARRVSEKLRAHCGEMASQCRQMAAQRVPVGRT